MSRDSRCIGIAFAVAVMAAACSDQGTAPAPGGRASRSAVALSAKPASLAWQEQARALIASNNLSPLAAGRVYAALSVAQYHAVMRVTDRAGGRSALEERHGAVAGASAEVLSYFFPSAASSLEERIHIEGESRPGNVHPDFTRGLTVGRSEGVASVTRLKNDHFTAPWTGTVPVGPGKWVANGPPAGATFSGVTPYFLNSGQQFRPAAPPVFGSPAFIADLNEVRTLSTTRTPAQLANAIFWNFPTGTFTPMGYWNVVAGNYIEGHGLDERAATHAFALMHAAMMDALIGCWDAKYYYWTLRPTQAEPLVALAFDLPNHPSYPSGHSCVSAAAAAVLSTLFPEKTSELEALVDDAGLSRIYAGIHYRFDVTSGRDLGTAVGRWAIAHANLLE